MFRDCSFMQFQHCFAQKLLNQLTRQHNKHVVYHCNKIVFAKTVSTSKKQSNAQFQHSITNIILISIVLVIDLCAFFNGSTRLTICFVVVLKSCHQLLAGQTSLHPHLDGFPVRLHSDHTKALRQVVAPQRRDNGGNLREATPGGIWKMDPKKAILQAKKHVIYVLQIIKNINIINIHKCIYRQNYLLKIQWNINQNHNWLNNHCKKHVCLIDSVLLEHNLYNDFVGIVTSCFFPTGDFRCQVANQRPDPYLRCSFRKVWESCHGSWKFRVFHANLFFNLILVGGL